MENWAVAEASFSEKLSVFKLQSSFGKLGEVKGLNSLENIYNK